MINHKEIVRYGFWGIITILVNVLSYYVLLNIGMDYIIANIFAIISSKTFAFISNKYFVFKSEIDKLKISEIVKFIIARGSSGLVDFFGLILLVEVLKIDEIYSKTIVVIITTIMNYILGKFFVFNIKKVRE